MKLLSIITLTFLAITNADPVPRSKLNFGDVIKDTLEKFKESMKCVYNGVFPLVPDIKPAEKTSQFNDYFL